MKRVSIIVPTLLISFTLTGCSLVSNLLGGGSKSEPKFENKGEQVTALQYSKELSEAVKDSKFYYDSKTHLESLTTNVSAYTKQTNKVDDNGTKTEGSTEMTGKMVLKYNANALVANQTTDVSYTMKSKNSYGSQSGTTKIAQDSTIQISKHELYTINNKAKTYTETSISDTMSDEEVMDQRVGSSLSSVMTVTIAGYSEKDITYYVNGKVFTYVIDYSDSEDLTNWNSEKVGRRETTVKMTYQMNLNEGKYSVKSSSKQTRHTEYTKDYNDYSAGAVEDINSVSYGTATIKFGSVKLEAKSLSGYTKIQNNYDY